MMKIDAKSASGIFFLAPTTILNDEDACNSDRNTLLQVLGAQSICPSLEFFVQVSSHMNRQNFIDRC